MESTLKDKIYEIITHEKQFESTEKEEQPSNKKIFEKLEAIERKLNLIFWESK